MNDRDPEQFEHDLSAGLRSAGRTIEPAATLPERVRDRLRVRRRRIGLRIASASAVVLAIGASALVFDNDDHPDRLGTADESVPPAESDPSLPPAGTTDPAAAPEDTFPVTDPEAMNILVVGTDNGACVEPDSPYAGAFGDRSGFGERSDTIMIVRIDPLADRASILSFPRDLWVMLPGRSAKGRINAAFVRDDPQHLIDTIGDNFGIGIEHFVQIDFCGFTTIVDAVGGVAVPFDQPVRDEQTGLDVPATGCRTMSGDEALAYVRSRHYEVRADDGTWHEDPSSDLGRIARQQDFIQRTMMAVFAKGLDDVATVRAVITAVQDFVVVDDHLTISAMLGIAGELRSMDPSSIGRYRIEAEPAIVANNAVLVPTLETPSMQAILAIFRGQPAPTASPADTAATTAAPAITVQPPDNLAGVVPPAIRCV